MTAEKLASLLELKKRIDAAKLQLAPLIEKLRPKVKGREPDTLKKNGVHQLQLEFEGQPQKITVDVPSHYAEKFLSELERHYDLEVRTLEAEFERS